MNKVVTVTREFRNDFEVVVNFYGLTDTEIEEAKVAVRGDLENAMECFASIAKQIRNA